MVGPQVALCPRDSHPQHIPPSPCSLLIHVLLACMAPPAPPEPQKPLSQEPESVVSTNPPWNLFGSPRRLKHYVLLHPWSSHHIPSEKEVCHLCGGGLQAPLGARTQRTETQGAKILGSMCILSFRRQSESSLEHTAGGYGCLDISSSSNS